MATDLAYMLHPLSSKFNLFMSCCCHSCCCFCPCCFYRCCCCFVVVFVIVCVICGFFFIWCYFVLFLCLCVTAVVAVDVIYVVVEIIVKLMFSVYVMILQVSRGCQLQSARHSAWRYLGLLRISSATSCASADHAQRATRTSTTGTVSPWLLLLSVTPSLWRPTRASTVSVFVVTVDL